MHCFCNFNTRSSSLETFAIPLTKEPSYVIPNGRHSNSDIPILLYKCLSCTGLVEEPTRYPLDRIAAITFKIILILVSLDWLISNGVSFHSLDWKTTVTNLAICMLVAGTYLAMYSKRNILTVALHNLGSSSNEKIINFNLIVICSMPAVLSTFRVIAHHDSVSSQFKTYGYAISNVWISIVLLSLKFWFYALVHPTFTHTSLVSLSYCILCQSYCCQINSLTKKVLQFSPGEFSPTKQMDILVQKAEIDKLLESVQAIFSVPSFFLIAIYFLMCVSVIRITIEVESFLSCVTVEVMLRTFIDFHCLFFMLWIAGGVPIQMKKLKHVFSEKVRARLLNDRNLGEIQPKGKLFGQSEFIFTGCDIILYTRSTLLSISGALLIYAYFEIITKNQDKPLYSDAVSQSFPIKNNAGILF
ncbi:uncharacterized protein TNCT_165181 [Trichonephila clavata]|uniref:Uncharacterized protein n=1 Tax=Trichonephila clavata TaxID=2740835 RepID=A0A8X6JCC9_TRICU|nr:uncharacterized protein TNCT_165181 [Trichonephila clavata]